MLRLADFARVCVYAQFIVLPSLGSSASHSVKQLGAERSCRLGCSARHARGKRSFRAISRQCLWICSVWQVAARYFEAQAASGQVLKVSIAGE